MKRTYDLFGAMLLLFVVLIAAGQSYADEIYCPPSIIEATVDENVIVSRSICRVDSSEIKGNVFIRTSGTLEISGSTIYGNIKLPSHGTLATGNSTHHGNIECEPGAEVFIGCAVEIKGNIDEKCTAIDACE